MSQVTSGDQRLIDEIYRDRVRRARTLPIAGKVFAGARLFDEASVRMRDGIRAQFPAYSPDEVETEFRRRLRVVRQLNENGYYRDAEPHDKS